MFHNDRSQVITLLKRVKTETVFKHQLPFYKIPTVLKLLQMFFLNTPFLPKKECISMTTDFEKKRKSEGTNQTTSNLWHFLFRFSFLNNVHLVLQQTCVMVVIIATALPWGHRMVFSGIGPGSFIFRV